MKICTDLVGASNRSATMTAVEASLNKQHPKMTMNLTKMCFVAEPIAAFVIIGNSRLGQVARPLSLRHVPRLTRESMSIQMLKAKDPSIANPARLVFEALRLDRARANLSRLHQGCRASSHVVPRSSARATSPGRL